jgi:hypothetical protein
MTKQRKQELNRQLTRETKPGRHWFVYNTKLSNARQAQINEWLLTLTPLQSAMLDDLLNDAREDVLIDD